MDMSTPYANGMQRAPAAPPLLSVNGVTLQYKTGAAILTATCRRMIVSSCSARQAAENRRC